MLVVFYFHYKVVGIVLSFPPGIVHSEMPGWEKTRGLQLWVNLPRSIALAIMITKKYCNGNDYDQLMMKMTRAMVLTNMMISSESRRWWLQHIRSWQQIR